VLATRLLSLALLRARKRRASTKPAGTNGLPTGTLVWDRDMPTAESVLSNSWEWRSWLGKMFFI
jgi:hypothetical protein